MALKRNEEKVKFGLKRVAFAIATIAEDGSAAYGDVITFPGARTLSMEPQGAGEPWNADDGVYYSNTAPTSRQGDLEMARIIDAFKRQVLGYIADANGVLVEDMSPAEVHFALLFETMNDKKPRRYVMYNCTATAPTVGSATNEGSKEPQTETTTITSMGIYVPSHDKWFDHGETTPKTDPEAYANWFNAVQVPGAPPAPYPIKTVSGNPVIITDGADNMAVEAMSVAISTTSTGLTLTRAGKNLLPMAALPSDPVRGVTFTRNDDGTIIYSGTTTAADLQTEIGAVTLPAGSYILTGAVDTTARLRMTIDGTLKGHDTGSGYSFTLETPAVVAVHARINTETGSVVSGTFSPMIRVADISDAAYEPYMGGQSVFDWTEIAGAITEGTLDVLTGVLTSGENTYQLTPTEVRTLHGDNTIWADSGAVTVSYHSDPTFDD